jgi:hypothetical protein
LNSDRLLALLLSGVISAGILGILYTQRAAPPADPHKKDRPADPPLKKPRPWRRP